jgi:hypothetical protein
MTNSDNFNRNGLTEESLSAVVVIHLKFPLLIFRAITSPRELLNTIISLSITIDIFFVDLIRLFSLLCCQIKSHRSLKYSLKYC